jgi:hypothetical protein
LKMSVSECPRCQGLNWNDKTRRFDKGSPKPTLRIENVMASTEMIHYVCNNCGHKEKQPYGQSKPVSPQTTLF